MTFVSDSTHTQPGDLVQLVSPSNKIYTVRLTAGGELHTHRGVVFCDNLIGLPWGSQVFSHLGSTFFLLPPALGNLLQETRRNTQIMYPKDIGFVLLNMGIGPGIRVIEAGTGSGALTTALAWAVGELGHIYSYEIRQEVQNLARKNIDRLGLGQRVTFHLRDIQSGFEETNVDALFLDVPNPYDFIPQVRQALKPGGFFGCILPTMNQVTRLLPVLHLHQFAFTDICEILLRYYKSNPQRLRPTDRMVAHTGYLIFARPVIMLKPIDEEQNGDSDEVEAGYENSGND